MLRTLLSKSLIRRRQELAGSGRYELHELVRQYAAERLAQMPDRGEGVCERHSSFYCALLTDQEARLKGKEQQAALAAIEVELDNIRNACRWALDQGQFDCLAQALQNLGFFYAWRSRFAEGEATYKNIVSQLQSEKEQPVAQQALVLALIWQSIFCRLLARLTESSQLLHESLRVLESSKLPELERQKLEAFASLHFGRLCEAQMDFATGETHYQKALVLYQGLDDGWGKANVCFGLGGVAYRTGSHEEARAYYEASLAYYEAIGDDNNSAQVLERLSFIVRDEGHLETAQQLTARVISLYEKLGDRAKIAQGQFALGWLYIFMGRFHEAREMVESSAAVFAELGLTHAFLSPAIGMGIVNLELGRYGEVRTRVEAHLEHSRQTGNPTEIAFSLMVLAYLDLVEQRYVEAEQKANESRALFEAMNDPDRLALAVACQGYAARTLGRTSAAWQYFKRALQSGVTYHNFITLIFTFPGIALMLAGEGKQEQAVELHAQLSLHGIVANSQFRYDLAGAHLEEIAAALPAQIAADARARGKAAELWTTAASLLAELNSRG
jgi:tetratricopeptide (TPR) repeat protein